VTGITRHSNDTLGRYLEQAADELAQSGESLGQHTEGLLFLGAWHQSYPAILVRDPFLSDSAKVHLLYLTQESSRQSHGAIAMPSLDQTARTLGHSWRTTQRDRTLLRVCRWISQHRRVRDEQGRYCGTINAIHNEPCSLHDANRLDGSYLRLLESSKDSGDRYVSRAAQAALATIDQALQKDQDPLEPADPIMRRREAAEAVRSGGGSFFDLMMPGGHTVATLSSAAEFAYGEPSANSAYGERTPSANSAHGDNKHKKPDVTKYTGYDAKFAYGPTCSSSNKTTTTNSDSNSAREEKITTGPNGHSVASSEMKPPLHWPNSLPANERTLIERAFGSRALCSQQRQDVLDALARKLRDPDNPLRSPVGYAVALCKRLQSGTFQPVGAPPQPEKTNRSNSPANAEASDIRQQMRNLRSEIQGLESTLIPGAPPGSRAALESQRDRLRHQLEQLKRQLRDLGWAAASADPSPM
jgi:hypothetical protein